MAKKLDVNSKKDVKKSLSKVKKTDDKKTSLKKVKAKEVKSTIKSGKKVDAKVSKKGLAKVTKKKDDLKSNLKKIEKLKQNEKVDKKKLTKSQSISSDAKASKSKSKTDVDIDNFIASAHLNSLPKKAREIEAKIKKLIEQSRKGVISLEAFNKMFAKDNLTDEERQMAMLELEQRKVHVESGLGKEMLVGIEEDEIDEEFDEEDVDEDDDEKEKDREGTAYEGTSNEDNLKVYIQEIAEEGEVLTPEREHALAVLKESNDPEQAAKAREMLIRKNLRLVTFNICHMVDKTSCNKSTC